MREVVTTLLDDLRSFLISKGYSNVFQTQYPETPDEIISVHEREDPMAYGVRGINYGLRRAPVQIRVRRKTIKEAEAAAWAIHALLDSGPNEESIPLAEGRNVTSRPIPPFFLELDERGRCSYVLKTNILTSKP